MEYVKRMNTCQKVPYDECLKVTRKPTFWTEMGGHGPKRRPGGRQVALVAVCDREGQVDRSVFFTHQVEDQRT